MNIGIDAIIAALGIPSAITGFGFAMLSRKIDKHNKENEEKEKARQENLILITEGVNATLALSKATAGAIKTGHANGDMEEALKRAKTFEDKQNSFFVKQNIKNLY